MNRSRRRDLIQDFVQAVELALSVFNAAVQDRLVEFLDRFAIPRLTPPIDSTVFDILPDTLFRTQ